jgi:hypothetical protein
MLPSETGTMSRQRPRAMRAQHPAGSRKYLYSAAKVGSLDGWISG